MKRKTLLVAVAAVVLGYGSCSKDEDNKPACSTAWSSELQDELNAVTTAGAAWANDPTPAKCNSYKASYEAYIDALKPYGNCSALTGQSRVDFNAALQAAEDDLVDLCD